jgi:hypothetical protein
VNEWKEMKGGRREWRRPVVWCVYARKKCHHDAEDVNSRGRAMKTSSFVLGILACIFAAVPETPAFAQEKNPERNAYFGETHSR